MHIHKYGRLMLQRELNIAKSILEKNNWCCVLLFFLMLINLFFCIWMLWTLEERTPQNHNYWVIYLQMVAFSKYRHFALLRVTLQTRECRAVFCIISAFPLGTVHASSRDPCWLYTMSISSAGLELANGSAGSSGQPPAKLMAERPFVWLGQNWSTGIKRASQVQWGASLITGISPLLCYQRECVKCRWAQAAALKLGFSNSDHWVCGFNRWMCEEYHVNAVVFIRSLDNWDWQQKLHQ